MQMPDVNILVYAHREESPGHVRYAAWLKAMANGEGHLTRINDILTNLMEAEQRVRPGK